ncbi:MAG: carbonic anhydrase, partial [Gammaproteobacteria bacterium]|nr:carbonic anhydrase [Gammaproteobacteria bacterium]
IVFDQGLGDLFVIRVAGNIVAPSQIGSIEFAVDRFDTRLVVVLGHSNCGAVIATIDELQQPQQGQSSNILSIVNRIKPAVEPLYQTMAHAAEGSLLQAAIRANILSSTNQLRHGSPLLEQLILKGELTVIGAEYSLETGAVEFYESV